MKLRFLNTESWSVYFLGSFWGKSRKNGIDKYIYIFVNYESGYLLPPLLRHKQSPYISGKYWGVFFYDFAEY